MPMNRAIVRLNDRRGESEATGGQTSLSVSARYRYPGQNSNGKLAKSGSVEVAMNSPKLRGTSESGPLDGSSAVPRRLLHRTLSIRRAINCMAQTFLFAPILYKNY